LVLRRTSPSDRSSRFVERHRRRCPAGQRLKSLPSVALIGGLVKRLPVGVADPFALSFGQLGEQVADAVNGAVLAV
jgi:hypothetical protein